ncbi:MAG: hypothetical protein II899_02050 [Bacteroidales bacterium]|nr:hypothetical protein [Bacteroidales bacterium]
MKKIFLLLFLAFVVSLCQAQYVCTQYEMNNECQRDLYSCDRVFPSDNQDTNLMMRSFIPTDTTPIITIPVDIHIWREDDGTGNYWLDTPAFRDSLRKVFGFLNYIYSTNEPYSETIPNAIFIEEARVRFEIDTFYYYNNSYLAHKNTTPPIYKLSA